MFDLSKIEKYRPVEKFREGQKECIEAVLTAFDKGKRFVILEAPTGSGKSVVAMTIAEFFHDTFYLTIQKILQDQLTKDFASTDIKSLKGRNAYTCNYWNTYVERNRDKPIKMKMMDKDLKNPQLRQTYDNKMLPCSEGVCLIKESKTKSQLCFPTPGQTLCPYYQAIEEAKASKTCIMNFHSFLFQTSITHHFNNRELMIIDEGHNSEPQLMNFVSLSITDKLFKRNNNIDFPKLDHAEQYAQYFDSIKLHELLNDHIRYLRYTNKPKEADQWRQILLQYTIFLGSVDSGNWIPKFEKKKGHNKVTLKPIFVDHHANEYLFKHADKILIMSATILSPKIIYESLGINPTDAYAYRMKNRFPKENRPIYFTPAGSMSYKNKTKTKPKLLTATVKVCDNYKDKKGIIHTHNFEIAEYFIDNGPKRFTERILYQKHFRTKDELFKEHAKRTNGIIVAPAMHEGLDLKDDLSRFQIICKVPFPALGDNEQLRTRMQLSPDYYDWLTALKLVQSYGRSVRSEEDWADTFILDADFGFFKKKARKQLPKWFLAVIQE